MIVEEVEIGICLHGFPGNHHYEEFSELCSLESELETFADLFISDEGDEFELLSSLIQFWLDEIRKRGYSLFYLLIGSIPYHDAAESISMLRKVKLL